MPFAFFVLINNSPTAASTFPLDEVEPHFQDKFDGVESHYAVVFLFAFWQGCVLKKC